MAAGDNAPVIIKRKKVVGGDGHHGGAWKVAYADFVTAMMAFFMLMWLLNATTEKQRKGIADYFSPTIPITRASGGGDGTLNGDSVFTQDALARSGQGGINIPAVGPRATPSFPDADPPDNASAKELESAEQTLFGFGGESMITDNALRHVVTRMTDEGLVIEIFDLTDAPLFEAGTARPTEVTRTLASMMAAAFEIVTNQVAYKGYVASIPVVRRTNPNWELSTERADAMRRLLEETGLATTRSERVSGHADREPAVPNPMSVRNNRVEVILLRSDL